MCLQYDYFVALTSCQATNVDSGSLLSVTRSDQPHKVLLRGELSFLLLSFNININM